MTGAGSGVLALLAGLALAGPAAGQSCTAWPAPAGGWAAAAGAGWFDYDLPGEARGPELGAEAWGRPLGPLALSAGYTLRLPADAPADVHVPAVRLAVDAVRVFGVGLCPMAGLGASVVAGDPSDSDFVNLTSPLGVAAGVELGMGREAVLLLSLAPFAYFSRVSGNVLGLEVEQDAWGFGGEAAAALRAGRLVARLTVAGNEIDADVGTPAVPARLVSVRLGYTF